jgi:hypothetical protein
VYLTGPYKGAPYGLAVEAPAVAGPFNLGTVVVRQALYVDPTTAQATAVTPLLDRPLSGPVYLVQRIRFGKQGQRIHALPSLLVPLRGQIAVDLRASSAVNGAQQLVTTFGTVPDAPVSKFTLTVNGGPKGILVITGRGLSICGKAQVANTQFAGQSGKTADPNPRLATPACAGFHATRHARRRGRRHAARRAGRSRAGGRRTA